MHVGLTIIIPISTIKQVFFNTRWKIVQIYIYINVTGNGKRLGFFNGKEFDYLY